MPNIHSVIGVVEQENGIQFITTRKSEEGCVLYGPYQHLSKGRYSVKFRISPDTGADRKKNCCLIDVVIDQGRTKLFERSLSAGELRDNKGEFEVEFDIRKEECVEYRVFATGNAGLRVACDRWAKIIMDSTTDLSFVASAENAAENRVFVENYGIIQRFSSKGAKFRVTSSDIIATVNGVNFHIDSREDLQLVEEICFINEYTFVSPKKCIAIDIGMNVGLASLALASNPAIERIHAFEPFKAPFTRALRNIGLNPYLSSKIETYNLGLSDKRESLEVLSQEFSTISTSLRGVPSGKPETIQVDDAGAVLGELIENANRRGLAVIMKVDCEGSEFAVFESLGRADLFRGIDALMIEWHKWWSKDKTQHHLIEPLTKAGFFVFDRTDVFNPHAGILLAVKTAPTAISSSA